MRNYLKIIPLTALTLAGCATINNAEVRMGWRAPPSPDTVVFFQPYSAALDQPALNLIATAAGKAQAQPNAPITITGSADNVGTPTANNTLSVARAQAVANTLESDGIPATRIAITGLGITPAPQPGLQFARRAIIHIGP